MFDEWRFKNEIRIDKYFRDLSIRPVSKEEIMWNPAYNLAILLKIPNLKAENSNKICKISMRIQNPKTFLFFVSFVLLIWICIKYNS